MGRQCKELRGWLDAYRRVFSKLPLDPTRLYSPKKCPPAGPSNVDRLKDGNERTQSDGEGHVISLCNGIVRE
jgi:hypothetical protein